jgi:hypothetical protein
MRNFNRLSNKNSPIPGLKPSLASQPEHDAWRPRVERFQNFSSDVSNGSEEGTLLDFLAQLAFRTK